MSIFKRGTLIQTTTINSACLELIGLPGERNALLEMSIILEAATASLFALGFSTQRGGGPTLLTSVNDDVYKTDNFPLIVTAWVTPPTLPSNWHRRLALPATIGAGGMFVFPKGLTIPAATSLVVANLASNGSACISMVWDD